MPSAPPPAVAVLQTGTYNSWNKGDAAMQLVAERFFTANDVQVVISTPFPQHDRQLYHRVCRSRRRDRIAGPALLGLSVLARVFGRLGRRLFLPDEEGRLMAEANLVVDLSGDMLTEDSGISAAVSHLIPIARAWILGTPYATAPQSIGPFRAARPVARFLLRRAQLVIARETITHRYLLNDLGIEPDRVMLAADLAFLLEPMRDAVPSVEAHSSAPRVGVSLSGLITERATKADIDDEPRKRGKGVSAVWITLGGVREDGPTGSKGFARSR